MCTTVFGVLAIGRAGTILMERQRIQHCADALALAAAVGDPVATTRLSRVLQCRIVDRSVSDGVVTVTVRTRSGTGTASASSGP